MSDNVKRMAREVRAMLEKIEAEEEPTHSVYICILEDDVVYLEHTGTVRTCLQYILNYV